MTTNSHDLPAPAPVGVSGGVSGGGTGNGAGTHDNGPSSNVIDLSSDQSVQAFNAGLGEATDEITTQGAALNKQSRSQLIKWKANGEQVVPVILDLAQKYGVVLPHYSHEQGRQDLASFLRIKPLIATTAALSQVVKDSALAKEDAVWRATLGMYSALASIAEHTPELAAELALVRSFFAPKKQPKSKSGGASMSPAAGATTGSAGGPPVTATPVPPAPAPVAIHVISRPTLERRQRHEVRLVGERRGTGLRLS